jgi:hypothetical protein
MHHSNEMGPSQSALDRVTATDRAAANLRHAFSHAPAALRIFRFAADSAPRVLEIAHVSAFLRECAVEFGSADATLPGAVRNEYAAKRFFKLRAAVERNAARCPWLAEKVLACRSGAPMPAAALAPDVTRHDVNWGAEGARRFDRLAVTHDGYGIRCDVNKTRCWVQGPLGVTRGKHFFQVSITAIVEDNIAIGFITPELDTSFDHPGRSGSLCVGAAFYCHGSVWAGTAPDSGGFAKCTCARECVVGVLLDLDATPAVFSVFVDSEPLEGENAFEYAFPKGREFRPSVAFWDETSAMHSCTI